MFLAVGQEHCASDTASDFCQKCIIHPSLLLCECLYLCACMQGRKSQHTLYFPLCILITFLLKRAEEPLWFRPALNYLNYHSDRAWVWLCVFVCVFASISRLKGSSTHASWTGLELFMSCHNAFSNKQHTNNWNNDVRAHACTLTLARVRCTHAHTHSICATKRSDSYEISPRLFEVHRYHFVVTAVRFETTIYIW